MIKKVIYITVIPIIIHSCKFMEIRQKRRIDYIKLYVVDRHIVTSIPLTESVMENFMEVTPILINNQDTIQKFSVYINSLKSKVGSKITHTYSIRLMCKVFYENGEIETISHSGINEVFYSGFYFEDNKKHLTEIIKRYVPTGKGWN